MTTLTQEKEAELRELMAKATPGPWSGALLFTENHTEANYDLIDAAVNALPDLLSTLSTERQAREAAEKEVERLKLVAQNRVRAEERHRAAAKAAEAKSAALEATLFTISKKPLSDGSEGALEIGGVLIDYDDGIIRARAALSALPPPVPAEEGGELKPVKMLVDADWLRKRTGTDPDADCEAGSPTQAPQDVAGLVEDPAACLAVPVAGSIFAADYEHVAAALRPSPISHETKALELAAADNNRRGQ